MQNPPQKRAVGRPPKQFAEIKIPEVDLSPGQAARLKQARQECEMTVSDLSRKSGVIINTIRKIEDGKILFGARTDTLYRLALALEVSPCWLAYELGAKGSTHLVRN